MRIRHLIILTASCLLCIACKKDIEINYNQVEPIYVVEGSVTNSGMEVRVSVTNNMNDNSTVSKIGDASVIITGSDGSYSKLTYRSQGIYRSAARGVPGVEYQLDVEVGGKHFTSTSTMQRMPTINRFYFIRKEILGENFQMGKLLLQDIPNEENYYFMHLYRNGSGYRWSVKKDDTNPNQELQQLFTFAREGSDDEDLLKEEDQIRLEVRTIDRKSYDYLYSMQVMDNTGTNPIQNFTGGCLGYFSAYSEVKKEYVFHEAEVEVEK